MRALDTSRESHHRQISLYRRMSPEQRMELAWAMSEESRELAAAGIRSRHPEYDAVAVSHALARLMLGDELFRAAWPTAPLLDP